MKHTELSARIMNDLTFNLKSSSIIIHSDGSGTGRLVVSDKQTQTDNNDSDTESNNLIINDLVDPDTVSQMSVVKFNFEACPSISSPVRSPLRSPSVSNGQINKTILKKQKLHFYFHTGDGCYLNKLYPQVNEQCGRLPFS